MTHPTTRARRPRSVITGRPARAAVLGLVGLVAALLGPAPAGSPLAPTPAAAAGDCIPPAPDLIRHPARKDGPAVGGGIVLRRFWARPSGDEQIQVTVALADLRRTKLVGLTTGRVGEVDTVAQLTVGARALVGINGDFFGMATSTRAVPEGVQVNGAVRFAPAGSTPYVGSDATGRLVAGRAVATGAAVVTDRATGTVRARLGLNAVNASPTTNGIAVITPALHPDNDRRGTWQVLVRNGVVAASAAGLRVDLTRYPRSERAVILLGRGDGGSALKAIPVGAGVTWSASVVDTVTRRPLQVAIGTGPRVLDGGDLTGPCTATFRSRAMVAWSADRTRVWLVTLNSNHPERWVAATGATHRQMGLIARDLGAANAVLLDGGGSTTLVGRVGGRVTRLDADRFRYQRQVADGLGLAPR